MVTLAVDLLQRNSTSLDLRYSSTTSNVAVKTLSVCAIGRLCGCYGQAHRAASADSEIHSHRNWGRRRQGQYNYELQGYQLQDPRGRRRQRDLFCRLGKPSRYRVSESVQYSIYSQVTCAVGPNILKFIAPVIGKAIDARTDSTPLAVIACENMIGATDKLAEFIKESKNTPQDRLSSINDRARFANSAIDRIVPGQDPDAGLNVKIESFYEWVVDKTPFQPHGPPKVEAIKWVDDLVPYIERKLFTVNTGHAAAAYYGHARGKHTIAAALEDTEINSIVRECLSETSHLIVNKHGISAQEQKEYVEKIIKRISNPHLEDVVERVGRAPLRKLGRQERFIGPAHHLAEQGDKYGALLGAIEQTFGFVDVEGDDESFELGKMLKSMDAPSLVSKVCGLEKSDKMFGEVQAIVEKVQKK